MAGLSQDTQTKIEDLAKFATFFEFISEPKKFKEVVDSASAVVAEMRKVVEAHTKVENATAFLAAAEAKVGETNKFVEDSKAAVAEAQKKIDTANSEREAAIHARELSVSKLQAEADAITKSLKEDRRKLDSSIQAQGIFEAQLAARGEELSKQEQEMKRRFDAMTALVR